ncbi:MAG: hypothetical protein HN394_21165, partial [Rhodospirillaceae bacterium]|nr:hypothetical protein [Rhodospirillaceae bacterium]
MKIGWGIDVGVASLGFAVIELDENDQPKKLIDGISVIYHAPVGAAERTRYKSIRTLTRRRKQRMRELRRELARLFKLDPGFDGPAVWPDHTDGITKMGKPRRNNCRVRLRNHGLEEVLSKGDLARAILHIAKNRGQRLTRGIKDDASGDDKQQKEKAKERTTTAAAANDTKAALAELGKAKKLVCDAHPAQLLIARTEAGDMRGTRLKKDIKGMPVFTRPIMESELKALLKAQAAYHPELVDKVQNWLFEKTFAEAEPAPQEIGLCRYGVLDTSGNIERRLPRGSDLFQRKRIFEEVNNLRVISARTAAERQLTLGERNVLVDILLTGKDLSASAVRKELKLGNGALDDQTSLDIKETRKGRKTAGKLQGHPLAAAMAKG